MDLETYAAEARVVETHWWFAGRRRLFASLIRGLGLAADDLILDVGTSSGTNLMLLRDLGFSRVYGVDFSPEAARWCAQRRLPPVILGDITAMPVAAESARLIMATDILEHVPDDDAALAEIFRVLAPGGHALIAVPAFPSLWGLQDIVSHHLRRYRAKPLLDKIGRSGLVAVESFHFNWLLFLPIWAARQALRLAKPGAIKSENSINTPLINAALSWVFRADIALARKIKPRFGVSFLVLARKPGASP